MAKAKKRGEQTRGVRELLQLNPKMATTDIIAAMASKGIKVKPHTVYVVKSHLKAKRRRQKREKIVATGNAAGIANPIEFPEGEGVGGRSRRDGQSQATRRGDGGVRVLG